MPIPNGAGGFTPYGQSFQVGALGQDRAAFQGRDQASVTDLLKADQQPVIDDAFGDFNTGMLGFLGKLFSGITTGLTGAAAAIAEGMANLFGRVDSAETDIVDLQDRAQVLEGVIGYGCRYMSTSPGVTTSAAVMPFDTQVGPVVGVTLQSGGKFRLDSKGLWRLESQVRFWGAALAPPRVYMDIVVRNSGGTEIARIRAMGSTDDEVTLTNVMPVVIPSSGCTAEVQAWTSGIPVVGGNWRGIGGGYSTTRFSAFKISDETS